MLDVNEFAPEIRTITPCSADVHMSTLSLKKLEYLVEANLDVLTATGDDQTAALVRIDAIDQDDEGVDNPTRQVKSGEHLSVRINEVRAMAAPGENQLGGEETNSGEDENSDYLMDALKESQDGELFTVDLDKQMSVYLDEVRRFAWSQRRRTLQGLDAESSMARGTHAVHMPIMVAFVTVLVEDRGEMSTKLNFVVILVNNRTTTDELKRLDVFMVKRFADNWSSLRFVYKI